MISVNTLGFVLVLAVGAFGALGWIIFDLKLQVRELASWRSTSANALKSYAARLALCEKEAPHNLGARVEELDDAVRRLKLTHQRFAGRFDQYVAKREPRVFDGETGDVDEELTATLALQNARNAAPGAQR